MSRLTYSARNLLRFWNPSSRIFRLYNQVSTGVVVTPPSAQSSLVQLRYNTARELSWIAAENLRYRTGAAFTPEQHHFVRYLTHSQKDLSSFYTVHRPTTVWERNFMRGNFPRVTSFSEPWLTPSFRDVGEGYLSSDHGNQAYGPASETKVEFEAHRLSSTKNSIERYGYYVPHRPFTRSNPVGANPIGYYLLVRDGSPQDFRAVVTNGGHRVAALVSLGWDLLPMFPQLDYPREVNSRDVAQWPGVVNGTFTEPDALSFFMSYFRDPAEVLLPDWKFT